MRTNYVLIDYENVQPTAMSVLAREQFKVIVFVGASQAKVSFEVASALQKMGANASYVKISGNGSNALDFHIAFFVGQLANAEPDAYFHIVSKDTGFDPLIAYLKTRKIFACRSKSVVDIPIIKASQSKSPAERVAVIVANFQHRGASKPRTVKTLSSTINSIFQGAFTPEEVEGLVEGLQKQGYITITDTKVTYALPE